MGKWITFDLDGTLMQNPFVGSVFPEIERLIVSKEPTIQNALGDILELHSKRIRENKLVEAYDWDGIVSEYLLDKKCGQVINIVELVKTYCTEAAIYLLEDDILKCLGELRERGFKLAAVTNGYLKYQNPVMEALGLAPLFDKIVTPLEAGFAKPDHRIFSIFKDEVVVAHVGDRIEHDIRAAYDASITSVLVNRKLPEELALIEISNRAYSKPSVPFLLEKLKRETNKAYDKLPDWAVPNYIIANIKELNGLV